MTSIVSVPFGWTPSEGFTLMSDFSQGPGLPPLITLTRNRDHAVIRIRFMEGATAPENLNELFPKKSLTEATDAPDAAGSV